MRQYISKILFLLLAFVSFIQTQASVSQDEFERLFNSGKQLYSEGRYTAAMEILLPLTKDNPENRFIEYSHYYYSLAAFKAGKLKEAKDILLQLSYRYPEWDQIQEARYLLANVYFEEGKFRYGMNQLKEVNSLGKDPDNMKLYYFNRLPIDSMKTIQSAYHWDFVLGEALAKKLSAIPLSEKDKMLLEYLVQEYKLDRNKFIQQKTTVFKKNYTVAVLLPFQYNSINPDYSKRNNQYILDIYEGIRMAVDSLNRVGGAQIQLFAYDTEKDLSTVNNILRQPEMQKMDLIIGPIFPTQIDVVTEFAKKYGVTVLNPLSVNSKTIIGTETVFMFQPTLEIQAGKTAQYVSENMIHRKNVEKDTVKNKKNVIIFYADSPRDSLLAVYYRDSLKRYGFTISNFEMITPSKMKRIQDVLADSMKLLKTSHVFVTHSDQVVAANVISAMEVSRQNVPVIARSEWLDFSLMTYEQFERRSVHFIHPDYFEYGLQSLYRFKKEYTNHVGVAPTDFSYQGYDMMLFFGGALKKYGTIFRDGISGEAFVRGKILYGMNFENSFSNTFVPITHFENHQLRIVNIK